MKKALRSQLSLLVNVVGYAFRLRPDAIFTTVLGVVSSFLEIVGLALLIPLSRLAAQQPILPSSPWYRLSHAFGFPPTVKFFVIGFFALYLARTLSQLLAAVLTNHLNRQLNVHFSTRALESFIHHLTFPEVQKESIGHFVSLAGNEAVHAALIVTSVMRLIPLCALFALYAVMLTYQSPPIAAGLVIFALVVMGCLWGAFKKSHELGRLHLIQSKEVGTHFIESLSGLRTVRSFTAENYVTNRYEQMLRPYMQNLFYLDAINSFGAALPTILLIAGMLLFSAAFASPSQLVLMLPSILVGVMMVLRLLPLVSQALDVTLRLTSDLKAAENISDMLEAVKSARIVQKNDFPDLREPIRKIEFDNVSFRYDASTPPVLGEFCAQFVAGRSYAITGPSGAGKSTIVDLLLKFYPPQGGTIRVNGKDIQALSNESLRKRIVLAEQAVRIFYDTIENNVQFGRTASSADVAQALDMVGLSEFLAGLPDGQRTLLNYQGGNVSGGQRQRIGLARALLLHADVLVMDESTSALDKATRERILERLLPLYRDRIVIFIAHDPAILELVDEVIHLGPALVEAEAV